MSGPSGPFFIFAPGREGAGMDGAPHALPPICVPDALSPRCRDAVLASASRNIGGCLNQPAGLDRGLRQMSLQLAGMSLDIPVFFGGDDDGAGLAHGLRMADAVGSVMRQTRANLTQVASPC